MTPKNKESRELEGIARRLTALATDLAILIDNLNKEGDDGKEESGFNGKDEPERARSKNQYL